MADDGASAADGSSSQSDGDSEASAPDGTEGNGAPSWLRLEHRLRLALLTRAAASSTAYYWCLVPQGMVMNTAWADTVSVARQKQKNVASLTDTCPPAFLSSHPQHAHIHRLVAAAQLETLHLSTPRQTSVDGVDGEAGTGSATTDAASTTNDASCSVAELVKQLTEREAAALAGAGDEQELSWENLSRDLQGSAPPGGQHPLAPHAHATPSC